MQYLDKTLATYMWNSWNIHLQHMCIAITTYYATPDLLLQQTSETYETYGCNMCSSTCYHPMEASWRDAGERSARHERKREAQGTRGARQVRCDCARREVQGCTRARWGGAKRGAGRTWREFFLEKCESWGAGAKARGEGRARETGPSGPDGRTSW
jgi:hypothetical protein